ncbi:MAG: calcium-binding protein, partial [Hyphomicrobiaceae bacterium]|nr:calcium-binding protein [Hyphomicrobiaceae bacterium]
SRGVHTFNGEDGIDLLILDWSASTSAVLWNGYSSSHSYYATTVDNVGQQMWFSGTDRFALTGGSGNDDLRGGALADTLTGNAGDDIFRGGAGDDRFIGGSGVDYVISDQSGRSGDFILSLLASQSAMVTTQSTQWQGIEGINLVTGSGNDQIDLRGITALGLPGGAGGSVLTSGLGNDTFAIDLGSRGVHTFNGEDGIDTLILDWSQSLEAVLWNGYSSFYSYYSTTADSVGQQMWFSGTDRFELTGGAGNDDLRGGALADTLIGNGGTDVLSGYDGDDVYGVDSLADVINDSAGIDTVRASLTWTLAANLENLELTGSAAIDGTGNASANRLSGNAGDNTLAGLAGNDTLNGGLGNDRLDGGADYDTADYAGASAGVTVNLSVAGAQATGGAGSDTLVSIEALAGSAHGDHLTGSSGDNRIDGAGGGDQLFGLAGADTLIGGEGNDTLDGGADGDSLDGGAGSDTVSYAASATGVTVNLATQAASGGEATGDTLSGIENVVGSALADQLTGSGDANTIAAGSGDDTVIGG